MTAPIISEAVFNTMDKNKDGYVSKGKYTWKNPNFHSQKNQTTKLTIIAIKYYWLLDR